jgi:thiosulfate/3-mercaptopyruvate sulfurtransferase
MKATAVTAVSTPRPAPSDQVLVDPEWLQARLCDPRVRVVEVDVSPAAYDNWHIDGAVLWNIYADLKDADYRLAGTAALERLVARSGIAPDSTVVFYGYAPALGLWLMKLYGHPDVRILDCSRETWRAGGYPWSTAASEPPAGGFVLGAEDSRIRADRAAVDEAIRQPETTLVDVRSAAEYRGERFWPSGGMEPGGRAGHVPSAVHQPIDGLHHEDGSFRSAAELRRMFAPAVLEGSGELITYCTIGGRAATAWFVLTYLIGRDRVRSTTAPGPSGDASRTPPSRVRNSPPDKPTSNPGGSSWPSTQTSCKNSWAGSSPTWAPPSRPATWSRPPPRPVRGAGRRPGPRRRTPRADVTLTAAKGDTRLVAHLSDRVSVPSNSQPHHDVPDPSVIAVRPQVPGIPADQATGSAGRASGSGATRP